MRLQGVTGIALLTAVALVPAPAQAGPMDACPVPPLAPVPLQAHQVPGGVQLHWSDELNGPFGIAVDQYYIFRVGLSSPPTIPFTAYAVVGGGDRIFFDPAGEPTDLYWVQASNCAGLGLPSNPASAFVIGCIDWGLISSAPFLAWVSVNRGCGTGPPCNVVLTLSPPEGITEWCG